MSPRLPGTRWWSTRKWVTLRWLRKDALPSSTVHPISAQSAAVSQVSPAGGHNSDGASVAQVPIKPRPPGPDAPRCGALHRADTSGAGRQFASVWWQVRLEQRHPFHLHCLVVKLVARRLRLPFADGLQSGWHHSSRRRSTIRFKVHSSSDPRADVTRYWSSSDTPLEPRVTQAGWAGRPSRWNCRMHRVGIATVMVGTPRVCWLNDGQASHWLDRNGALGPFSAWAERPCARRYGTCRRVGTGPDTHARGCRGAADQPTCRTGNAARTSGGAHVCRTA